MILYGHNLPNKVFVVHLVVENYVAIFVMPVTVSEIRVDRSSIVTFDPIMPCDV